MAKAKRFADGGTLAVGAYMPQAPTSAGVADRSQTTNEVLNNMDAANSPVVRAKNGGYVKSADGIAVRGKTRGRYV